MVADVSTILQTIKMSNSTKVPVMRPNQPYEDWLKELRIWEATNVALCIEPKIQASSLFQSLQGTPRQTVLSELTVEEIIADNGVKNIIQTLDSFYLENRTQNAFNVLDDLMSFKRTSDMTIQNFIIKFQLKINRVKNTGMVLCDEFLGYALLKAANLSSNRYDLVKATCGEFTYNNIKTQLVKIALSYNGNSISTGKFEQCFCGNLASFTPCPDLAQQRNQFDRLSSKTKLKPNSTDKIRTC